jgi:hypothetical protein
MTPPMPAPVDPAAAAGAKPATKKVDPQIIDTKLWQIMRMVVELMNKFEIPIPADVAMGPPPDPAAMQQANAQQVGAMPAAVTGQDGGQGGGQPGAAPDPAAAGIPPIDPQLPQAKVASTEPAFDIIATLSALSGATEEKVAFNVGVPVDPTPAPPEPAAIHSLLPAMNDLEGRAAWLRKLNSAT